VADSDSGSNTTYGRLIQCWHQLHHIETGTLKLVLVTGRKAVSPTSCWGVKAVWFLYCSPEHDMIAWHTYHMIVMYQNAGQVATLSTRKWFCRRKIAKKEKYQQMTNSQWLFKIHNDWRTTACLLQLRRSNPVFYSVTSGRMVLIWGQKWFEVSFELWPHGDTFSVKFYLKYWIVDQNFA